MKKSGIISGILRGEGDCGAMVGLKCDRAAHSTCGAAPKHVLRELYGHTRVVCCVLQYDQKTERTPEAGAHREEESHWEGAVRY